MQVKIIKNKKTLVEQEFKETMLNFKQKGHKITRIDTNYCGHCDPAYIFYIFYEEKQ